MKSNHLLLALGCVTAFLAIFVGYQIMNVSMGYPEDIHSLHLPIEYIYIRSYGLTAMGAQYLVLIAKHSATVLFLVFVVFFMVGFERQSQSNQNTSLLIFIIQILAFLFMSFAQYLSPFVEII